MSTEEGERKAIQEQLSNMTFEELLKLKEELGGKAYDEAVFGVKSKNTNFKRKNKNRPREMSSKFPAPITRGRAPSKTVVRDPRFDPLCGKYKEQTFKKLYSFINDIRSKEMEQLQAELKTTKNENRKGKIKYLITRMENQDREERRRAAKQEQKKEEHKAHIELLRQGKLPKYRKKSEKQLLELVERYEELKKSGKLLKHIEKRKRKDAKKDRKKWNVME